MLTRILFVVVVVPLAVIAIALAVANRAAVPLTLDPFNPGNPALTIELPFFIYLFLALIAGIVIGGCATWIKQGHYRKLARTRAYEAERPAAPVVSQPEATGTALARPGA
jgi:uncharacterized integral membrane protein